MLGQGLRPGCTGAPHDAAMQYARPSPVGGSGSSKAGTTPSGGLPPRPSYLSARGGGGTPLATPSGAHTAPTPGGAGGYGATTGTTTGGSNAYTTPDAGAPSRGNGTASSRTTRRSVERSTTSVRSSLTTTGQRSARSAVRGSGLGGGGNRGLPSKQPPRDSPAALKDLFAEVGCLPTAPHGMACVGYSTREVRTCPHPPTHPPTHPPMLLSAHAASGRVGAARAPSLPLCAWVLLVCRLDCHRPPRRSVGATCARWRTCRTK